MRDSGPDEEPEQVVWARRLQAMCRWLLEQGGVRRIARWPTENNPYRKRIRARR